jgi:hypothetical protein
MAFDYLLRWEVKRRNPEAIERRWVAEIAADILEKMIFPHASEIDRLAEAWNVPTEDQADMIEEIILRRSLRAGMAKNIVAEAKKAANDYVKTGKITGKLLRSALFLAELDRVYREGIVPHDLGVVYDDDIKDLRCLLKIVPPDLFHASRLCVLNPAFGEASSMIHGADADLLIDETLIEIKTTKLWKIRPEYIFQLAGYYLLSRIDGIDGAPAGQEITHVGIYFARFGYLFTVSVEKIIQPETISAFEEWFRSRLACYEIDRM